MDSKMKAKLAKFNKNFSKEKKKADELGGFAEIPDGKYLAKVSGCEIKNSNAGEMHLVFMFEITESAEDESLVGAKASKWCNIEKEDGPAYLIRDLRRFGIELEDLEQLDEIAKMIDDQKPEVKISLKTGNSGQFTYIDQVISEIDAGDHAASEETGEEEEEEESSEEESEEEVEETESEESEEEDVQLDVGTVVQFTSKKGEGITGEITKVDEKAGTVDIKSGDRSFKGITADRLSIPEDSASEEETEEVEEEEEEEEDPKPKAKAKAKAPAPKAAPKKAAPKAAAKKSARKK